MPEDSKKILNRVKIIELKRLLQERFNDSDLRQLIFDLEDVEYEDLAGDRLILKIQSFLEHLNRRNRLDDIYLWIKVNRLDIDLSETEGFSEEEPKSSSDEDKPQTASEAERDLALQSYLNDMQKFVERKTHNDASIAMVQALTDKAWPYLDDGRKSIVIKLLIRTNLLEKLSPDKKRLRKVNLMGAQLEKANLKKIDMFNAKLQKSNLSYANLEDAFLSEANFEGAKLNYANLKNAVLEKANLVKTDLEGAILEKGNYKDANFERSWLVDANLVGANFRDVNFQKANFTKANLEKADLRGANLRGAFMGLRNVGGSVIGFDERANIQEARLNHNTIMPNGEKYKGYGFLEEQITIGRYSRFG